MGTTTTIDRRRFLATAAAAGAGLTVASGLSGLASDALANTRHHHHRSNHGPDPLWGAYCRPKGGQTWEEALTAFESEVGRTMSITRHYYRWDETVPDAFARFAAAGGRVPYVSIHAFTRGGDFISWSDIAAGKHDDQLALWADALQSWGVKGYLNFHHEPENDLACGTARDFRAAFGHMRSVFDAHGVTNFVWTASLMASTLNGGHGGPGAWLPAADTYRVIAVDGYNRFPSDTDAGHWRSFHEIFRPAHHEARRRHKRLLIGEYGSVEQDASGYRRGSPHAKGQWFDDAARTMRRWPELVGAIYSHTTAEYGGQVMNYWADTSAPSLSAFTNCGHHASFS
jgi:hypothetical protein